MSKEDNIVAQEHLASNINAGNVDAAVEVGRFEDGKIVERWGSSDELGILRQLGAEPKVD